MSHMDKTQAYYENGNIIAKIETSDLLEFIENYISYTSSHYYLHIEGFRFTENNKVEFILNEVD